MRLIDADALYERLKADEELARDRVIDTPNSFPNGAVNPFAIRYMAQLNERTRFKEIVFDAPTIEKTEWIPVTERLPKPVAESQKREWFITSNQYGGVTVTCYEFESSPFKEGWQTDMTILAWMPLPAPWKGGAEMKGEEDVRKSD